MQKQSMGSYLPYRVLNLIQELREDGASRNSLKNAYAAAQRKMNDLRDQIDAGSIAEKYEDADYYLLAEFQEAEFEAEAYYQLLTNPAI